MDYDKAMFLFGGSGRIIRNIYPMPGLPIPESSSDPDDPDTPDTSTDKFYRSESLGLLLTQDPDLLIVENT